MASAAHATSPPRVLLLNPRAPEGADGLARLTGDRGSGPVVERCDDVSECLRRLDELARMGSPADALLIGPDSERPLGSARRIRERHAGLQIVFLVPAERLPEFRQTLLFSPQLGDAWTAALGASAAELEEVLRTAGRKGRRHRRLRGALDAINRQLRAEPEEPTPLDRRLQISDRYLATLLSSAPDAIVSTDLDGRILSWNEAAARTFGREYDEVVGEPLTRLFPPGLGNETDGWLAAARRQRVSGQEARYRDEEDRVRDAELTLALVRDEADQPLGVVVIARDITERLEQRRMLEETSAELEATVEELRTRTAEAEAASRAKGEFLAAMSHELRTPLQAVIGYAALLEGGLAGELEPQQQDQVARIHRSAEHLLSLIDQVLDVSRAELGSIELRPEPTDLCGIAEQVADLLAGDATRKGLDLTAAPCADDRLRNVLADAGRIRQILVNLVGNAVKFTETGQVRIETEWRAGEAAEVAIAVVDTGIGLGPEQVGRIFEPFWQADMSPSRRAAGIGLGLAISRRLAEAMGGRIEVESRPGTGSRFTLVLPVPGQPQ